MKRHCCHILPLRRRRLAWRRREADSGAVSAPEACHYHITIKSEHTPSVRNADKLWHSLVCAERRSDRKEFGGSEKFSVKFQRMHTARNIHQVSDAVSVLIKSTFFFKSECAKLHVCRIEIKWQKSLKLKQLRICLHIKKKLNHKPTCAIPITKYQMRE